MTDVIDHDKALEKEIESASAEDKAVVSEGLSKTTAADRQFIRDEVAEGRMTPAQCAKKFLITPQYVSKLLKQAGIRFGIRKMEREAKERAEIEAKERAAKASFAERKATFAEEHKMSAMAQLRSAFLLEGMRQKIWREAAVTSAALPSPKEAAMSARTMSMLDQRIRILLELDTHIDEKELPSILINDMGDEDILAIRRGKTSEDILAKLDDDVVEESV